MFYFGYTVCPRAKKKGWVEIDHATYAEIMEGNGLDQLNREKEQAVANQDFEAAARLREQAAALEDVCSRFTASTMKVLVASDQVFIDMRTFNLEPHDIQKGVRLAKLLAKRVS